MTEPIIPAEPAFILTIPFAGEWMTMNDRRHWRVTKTWKDAWAGCTLAAWHQGGKPKQMPPCTVDSTFVFANKRRRDPHNFVPTLKPIIDQLVKLDVWPDDNPDWVRVPEPKILITKDVPMGVVLRAYPFEV